MQDLKKILSLYKFKQENLAEQLEMMLIKAIEFHYPDRSQKEILESFSNEDLIIVLNNLIFYTQQFFFARENERWDLLIPAWIEANKTLLFKLCKATGLGEPVNPISLQYDAVAIFGANKSEIFRRYNFLYRLLKSASVTIQNRIYLLTGQRKLTPRIDGSEAYFAYLHNKFGPNLFETQIMIDLYEKFNFPQLISQNVQMRIINTPALGSRRPDTYDTLVALQKELDPNDKKLLFISRSPTILEQRAAVDRVFSGSCIDYEVAGGGSDLCEVQDEARAAYHVLMSIAGALYENYLVVATAINSERKLYNIEELVAFKKQLGYRNSTIRKVIFSQKHLTAKNNKAEIF
jgi:hypothetical protein